MGTEKERFQEIADVIAKKCAWNRKNIFKGVI